MKKKLILISIICMGAFLCGCEGNLNSVNKNSVNNKESPTGDVSTAGHTDVKYCTVSELRKTKISDIEYQADNLKFPSEIDFSGIGEVSVLTMETEKIDVKEKQAFYAKLFGVGEKGLWKNEKEKNGNILSDYDDKENKTCCVVGEAGFVFYSNSCGEEKEYEMKESYNLKQDDISAVKVGLKDGDQPLSLMCTRARKWLEDNMKIKGFDYKLTEARVLGQSGKEQKGTSKLLELSAEYEYKGISVCNFNSDFTEREFLEKREDGIEIEPSVYPFGIEMKYTALDKLSSFSNLGGRLKLNEAEKQDQVVDLESAIKIVHQNLSGLTYRFDDIVPLYILKPQRMQGGENSFKAGIKVKAEPVYAFIIKDYRESTGIKANCGKYCCLVDMVSGNFSTNFDGSF